jgi:hypothetical protein
MAANRIHERFNNLYAKMRFIDVPPGNCSSRFLGA